MAWALAKAKPIPGVNLQCDSRLTAHHYSAISARPSLASRSKIVRATVAPANSTPCWYTLCRNAYQDMKTGDDLPGRKRARPVPVVVIQGQDQEEEQGAFGRICADAGVEISV